MIIFACVGTGLEQFDRMVAALDAAIDELGLGSSVSGLLQQGSCTHGSRHLENRPTLSRAEFREWMARADVVVCHAGVGAIRAALDAGHRPLVMARRLGHREVINDHQVEILEELARKGLVCPFVDATELVALLRSPPERLAGATRAPAPLPAELTSALELGAKRSRATLLGRALLRALSMLGPRLDAMRVERRG